ncbi:Lrp/AsnC family transcriptional regulator [Bacillus thermotolerans]|uniref:Transcriptional regulator, AsnC family n=1 Tax=Bacillus thermotolerans TaxID=1221996 RepID=A0A0F5HRG9_BACTR|nr:Lrp/AsnC family transcriptional regulator [Bacillus thermotolerans]KKB35959.1 Transcriptional regulator, AsnC family [Bacillus thermotolerans]KKB41150.1 Transcriptional regulator, AsnC family [Bacillus thermotolerans]KKB43012.1 Transcriptional regulator, AsnC family [Bacillus thermotolerans]
MDEIDIQLLKILQEDGRITLSDLSKKLSLSRPSVAERFTRLMEKGIIDKISAKVSPPSVGRHILLFIQVSEVSVPYEKFEQMTAEHPDIIECHRVTGKVNYLMKAAVNDMEHLTRLVDYLIPYGIINTSIVLKSPVPEKIMLPTEEEQAWPASK